jgi:hypothetical protein
MNKTLLIAIAVAIALVLGLFLWFRETSVASLPEESIRATYPGKIVYSVTPVVGLEQLRTHCASLMGTFNECGNDCDPNAQVCDLACALTCENIPS